MSGTFSFPLCYNLPEQRLLGCERTRLAGQGGCKPCPALQLP